MLETALSQTDSGVGKYAVVEGVGVYVDLLKKLGDAYSTMAKGFTPANGFQGPGDMKTIADGATEAESAYEAAMASIDDILSKNKPSEGPSHSMPAPATKPARWRGPW